jgi:protein-disulfide isomerase
MAWKIAYGVLAVIAAFLIYGIYTMAGAKGALKYFPPEYTSGPADADLTVVEFMDFDCIHCRNAHPIINEAVAQDGKVRYAPVPLPVLTGDSAYAVKLTYAAAKQGKYKEAVDEFITNYGKVDESNVTDIALKLGVDGDQLKADAESEEIKEAIARNLRLFMRLEVRGTPTFFIGYDMKYEPKGSPTVENFLSVFNEARATR